MADELPEVVSLVYPEPEFRRKRADEFSAFIPNELKGHRLRVAQMIAVTLTVRR